MPVLLPVNEHGVPVYAHYEVNTRTAFYLRHPGSLSSAGEQVFLGGTSGKGLPGDPSRRFAMECLGRNPCRRAGPSTQVRERKPSFFVKVTRAGNLR